ncbi:MAG: DegV family protein [Atopobiaceae bacterium]|nr:DegV family protein [Atopobiaceae bacterium]
MKQCTVISDSTSDLSAQLAATKEIEIIPFHFSDSKQTFSGDDDLFQSVSVEDFYGAVRSGLDLMTSQPSQLEYEECFERILESKVPALVFCISSGISGGYEGARTALDRITRDHPEAPEYIYIIDTLLASTPMQLLVLEACNKRDEGMSAAEIYAWALEARWQIQTLFMVEDLDALHRGGRIPKGVALAGGKLNVKPLLNFDLEGKLKLIGVARGRKKALDKLARNYLENRSHEPLGNLVAIGDADVAADGDGLVEQLQASLSELTAVRSTIGPTIACHVGAGMVSCCFWGKDRRAA